MNNTLNIFGGLIIGSIVFLTIINYMASNIEDFESVPLPPPKQIGITTHNPTIKVDATSRKKWTLVDFSIGKTYSISDSEKEKDKLISLHVIKTFHVLKVIAQALLLSPVAH